MTQTERRNEARANGMCIHHTARVALYGRKHCEDCLIRYQRRYKNPRPR